MSIDRSNYERSNYEASCEITGCGCRWECTGELADNGEENYWDYLCLDCGRERDWSKYEYEEQFIKFSGTLSGSSMIYMSSKMIDTTSSSISFLRGYRII